MQYLWEFFFYCIAFALIFSLLVSCLFKRNKKYFSSDLLNQAEPKRASRATIFIKIIAKHIDFLHPLTINFIRFHSFCSPHLLACALRTHFWNANNCSDWFKCKRFDWIQLNSKKTLIWFVSWLITSCYWQNDQKSEDYFRKKCSVKWVAGAYRFHSYEKGKS